MKYLIRKVLLLVPYYKYINLLIRLIKVAIPFIMADKKGLLDRDEEKWLSKFLDDAIKLKGLAEVLDGAAIRVLVSTLDNIVAEKYIPEDWKNPLKELIKLGKARDKAGIAKLLESKVDIPFIDDDMELLAFTSVINFIGAKMYAYIDSVE